MESKINVYEMITSDLKNIISYKTRWRAWIYERRDFITNSINKHINIFNCFNSESSFCKKYAYFII